MKQIKTKEDSMNYVTVSSPLGEFLLAANASALAGVYFAGQNHIPAASRQWRLNAHHPVLQKAAEQLEEYFAGTRTDFSLPLQLAGTDFQIQVWRQIALIPYGKTTSYSDLAKCAGAPQAIRATGTATGRNPLAIIIPCHRVMGKNGDLRGFAGGLERKRELLKLEQSVGQSSH